MANCKACLAPVIWARFGKKPDGSDRWRTFDAAPHPLGVFVIVDKRATVEGPSKAEAPDRYLPHEETCANAKHTMRRSALNE